MTPLEILLHPRRVALALTHAEQLLASERARSKEARIAAAQALRTARQEAARLDEALANISSLTARLEESTSRITRLEAQCAETAEMKQCLELADRNIKKVKKMKERYEERIKTLEKRLEAANATLRQKGRRTFAEEDDLEFNDDDLSASPSTHRYTTPSPTKRENPSPSAPDPSQGDWLESLPTF